MYSLNFVAPHIASSNSEFYFVLSVIVRVYSVCTTISYFCYCILLFQQLRTDSAITQSSFWPTHLAIAEVVTLTMSNRTVGLVQMLIEPQICIESTDVQCCKVVLGVFLNQSLTPDHHHKEDVELASFWDFFG